MKRYNVSVMLDSVINIEVMAKSRNHAELVYLESINKMPRKEFDIQVLENLEFGNREVVEIGG